MIKQLDHALREIKNTQEQQRQQLLCDGCSDPKCLREYGCKRDDEPTTNLDPSSEFFEVYRLNKEISLNEFDVRIDNEEIYIGGKRLKLNFDYFFKMTNGKELYSIKSQASTQAIFGLKTLDGKTKCIIAQSELDALRIASELEISGKFHEYGVLSISPRNDLDSAVLASPYFRNWIQNATEIIYIACGNTPCPVSIDERFPDQFCIDLTKHEDYYDMLKGCGVSDLMDDTCAPIEDILKLKSKIHKGRKNE